MNEFRRFWNAGYRRLVPITPPGCPVSPDCSFAHRPRALGKAPGFKRSDGLWTGVNWLKMPAPTEADLDLWHSWGAGVGIRTGDGLIAVDIDTLNPELGDVCGRAATDILGKSNNRIGRAPKRLKLYRTTDVVPYQRVIFDDGLPHKPGAEPRVEILSDDRQFVAAGVHPDTGQPYTWPTGVEDYDKLPLATPWVVAKLMAYLAEVLPAAEQHSSSIVASRDVDQVHLLGKPETIAAAVEALPNTTELFPTYDDYVRVGYAIKGASQSEAGLELFQAWAAKWEGGNDPDTVAADWSRMKPPFEIGAQFLYDLAERHSQGGFSASEAWFEAGGGQSANPFDNVAVEATPAVPVIEPIRWIDPEMWAGEDGPPREWEVDGWIPRRQVTLLYGEGGIGKTLLIHQYGICAAAGIPWLGQTTRQARVMAVFCEDDEDELHRRHYAILKALGLKDADLGGRFRFVSRVGEDNYIAALNRGTGTLQPTAFYKQILKDTVAWRTDVTVIDTIADTFGGSEIDRGQVNAFVKTILGGIVKATRGSVAALGHPSVAGKGEGRSGSTGWANAARSRMYLRYPPGTERGNLRELAGTKTNYGPVGALLKLRWSAGHFKAIGESKPASGASAAVASLPSVESMAERQVLAAVAASAVDQTPLNLSPRSLAYAPKVLKRLYADLLETTRQDEIAGALASLERQGLIKVVAWSGSSRNAVTGYTVVAQPVAGAFD